MPNPLTTFTAYRCPECGLVPARSLPTGHKCGGELRAGWQSIPTISIAELRERLEAKIVDTCNVPVKGSKTKYALLAGETLGYKSVLTMLPEGEG